MILKYWKAQQQLEVLSCSKLNLHASETNIGVPRRKKNTAVDVDVGVKHDEEKYIGGMKM